MSNAVPSEVTLYEQPANLRNKADNLRRLARRLALERKKAGYTTIVQDLLSTSNLLLDIADQIEHQTT